MSHDPHIAGMKPARGDGSASALYDPARALPSAVEMERCVISCMMQAPDFAVPVVIERRLQTGDFSVDGNGLLFDLVRAQWNAGRPVDPGTITQLCYDRDIISKVGGSAAIGDIYTASPNPAHCAHFCEQVEEKSQRRAMINACSGAINEVFNDCPDHAAFRSVVEDLETTLMALSRVGSHSRKGIRSGEEVMIDVIRTMVARNNNKGRPLGLTLGFADLDRRINGLRRGDFIVLGARPAMGKTSLGTAFAEAVAIDAANEQNKDVLMFTLEMSDEQIMERSSLGRARIGLGKGRGGMFTDAESSTFRVAEKVLIETRGQPAAERSKAIQFAAVDCLESYCQKKQREITQEFFKKSDREIRALSDSIAALSSGRIKFYDGFGVTSQEVRSEIRKWVRSIGWSIDSPDLCPPLVIVDYLQLVKASEKKAKGDPRLASMEVCDTLKGTAKELGVVIIGLAQLTRSSEDNPGKEPAMRDLKESGAFEEYADYVWLLHRESYYWPWAKLKEDKQQLWQKWAEMRNKAKDREALGEEPWEDDDTTAGQKYYEAAAKILIRKGRHCPCDDVEILFHGPMVRFASKTAALFSTNAARREKKEEPTMENVEF